MNGKLAKKIRKQADDVIIGWMKSLLSDVEAEKVNRENIKSMLPKTEYVWLESGIKLNAFHPKWVQKRIKRLIKTKPLSTITFKDMNHG